MEISSLQEFIINLRRSLLNPPGVVAYERMIPKVRERLKNLDVSKIEGAKLSSVLILLYSQDGKLFIPLTRRHDYEGTHGGQISLPGGKMEKEDKTRIDTALREAQEEIGIDAERVEVLGTISEIYIPPSNFKVLPVVGLINEKPTFVKEEFEVAEIIETEVAEFLNPHNFKTKHMEIRGGMMKDVPYFDIHGHVVWGATAMILTELIYILENLY